MTSSDKNLVTRINAFTNIVEETIAVGPKPRFLAVGLGSVWTINQGDGTISRIDAKTNKVIATIEAGIPGGGGEIAVGEGSVWVMSFEYPVTRINPTTNTVGAAVLRPRRRRDPRRARIRLALQPAAGQCMAPRSKRIEATVAQ